MRGRSASKIFAGLIGSAVLVVGVLVLRATTMTEHDPVDPTSELAVELEASRAPAAEHDLLTMVEGLVRYCQLEVGSTITDQGIRPLPGDRFRFQMQPTLDGADQEQLAGCLNDMTVDHLTASVNRMETVDL